MTGSTLSSPIAKQLRELRKAFPGATAENRGDGTTLIHVPQVPLGKQWHKRETDIWFLAPPGYPVAQPDCFWADHDLALTSGAPLQNAQQQVPPFGGAVRMWFSWHLQRWNAQTDSLLTYMRVIQERLARAQ